MMSVVAQWGPGAHYPSFTECATYKPPAERNASYCSGCVRPPTTGVVTDAMAALAALRAAQAQCPAACGCTNAFSIERDVDVNKMSCGNVCA
jgi:hypothetical protein